jgi:hypothetical protein
MAQEVGTTVAADPHPPKLEREISRTTQSPRWCSFQNIRKNLIYIADIIWKNPAQISMIDKNLRKKISYKKTSFIKRQWLAGGPVPNVFSFALRRSKISIKMLMKMSVAVTENHM